MLDFVFRPLRSALAAAEHEIAHSPLERTEEEVLTAVNELRQVTESIEHHVEVIENLATSIDPLKESVINLTATMQELVAVLAPLAAAERGVKDIEQDIGQDVSRVGHLFGRHRKETTEPQ